MSDTLLLIEDEELLGGELEQHYRGDDQGGWEVVRATTLAEARQALYERRIQPLVVLSDMSLPDGNALDLLEEERGRGSSGEWILLTGYGSVPDSVRALRLGAFDFLEKPCDLDRLDLVVAGAARSARAQRRLDDQSSDRSRQFAPEAFLGRSALARGVRELLARLCEAPFSTLLLTGETGTGKGLAARILHHSGLRRGGPLVEINCAALPHELLESELFGHEAGAFTGARGRRRGLLERADGGTLFLDEVGELPLELQAKLLRAVEDRTFRRLGGDAEIKVDVAIVAASNRDLESRAADGSFRPDLYHRLSVFQVELPPLRRRLEDLDDLVPAIVEEFNGKAGKRVRTVPEPVWNALRAHSWPGNVRELRNVIERCVLLATGEEFPEQWLQLHAATTSAATAAGNADEAIRLPLDGSVSLDEMERRILEHALARHQGNVSATAKTLGTTRETLRYRVQKYGLGD